MKILIDMNLSPRWEAAFTAEGWHAVHWSKIGQYNASDQTILAWAKENKYIIFTHDLDFGNLLAATAGNAPSVIQVRTQNVFPDALGTLVVKAIRQFQEELMRGALISIDEQRARAHILPFYR